MRSIHARTARFLFGEHTVITSELRRIAKSVNFGVIYGITGFGLSKLSTLHQLKRRNISMHFMLCIQVFVPIINPYWTAQSKMDM